MAGEGGNIVRNVFGKSYKEAEGIMKDASNGTLDFKSPQENTFYGKQGGKKFDEYQGKKETQPLLVKQVKCYEDFTCTKEVKIIKKGVKYYFKATQYSRTPSKSELKNLKWAIQYDDTPLANASQVTGEEKISYTVPKERKLTKLKVYAFFKAPDEQVKAEVSFKILPPIIIFVNGYWNVSWLQKDALGFSDGKSLAGYWGTSLRAKAIQYFGSDSEVFFLNGADTAFSSGNKRYANGKDFAVSRFDNKQSKFYKAIFEDSRRIMVVSHSMGGAFAEGVISVLKEKKLNVEKVVHLSPADNSGFSANYPDKTYQLDISWDPVLMYKNLNDRDYIGGVKAAGLMQNPGHDQYGHANTKLEGYVWDWFEDLEVITLTFSRTETVYQRMPSDGLGPATSIPLKVNIYKSSGMKHNKQFIKIYKNKETYHEHSKNEYEKS
ncbi:hypothetical protein [Chryseobacterium taiwanense]|uniref:Uncharacterized protein n=1 Tax=Chryseobacterium taiwanense TaxID=363331 RepID=A0A0B4DGM0_9FLAO|nr:hypothetical protein [Chryseobacterium taiwanense]KIC63580.1 hypothetical protein RM51_07925 [Chryseobacterium taiwanense]